MRLELHVLMFQEKAGDETVWVAQCLEHDIVGHGPTLGAARANFATVLKGEIKLAQARGFRALRIPPPPADLLKQWEDAEPLQRSLPMAELSAITVQGQAEIRLSA